MPIPTAAPWMAATIGFESRDQLHPVDARGHAAGTASGVVARVGSREAGAEHGVHVGAGAEPSTGAGQDDRPDAGIVVGPVERVGKFLGHVRRPRLSWSGRSSVIVVTAPLVDDRMVS